MITSEPAGGINACLRREYHATCEAAEQAREEAEQARMAARDDALRASGKNVRSSRSRTTTRSEREWKAMVRQRASIYMLEGYEYFNAYDKAEAALQLEG